MRFKLETMPFCERIRPTPGHDIAMAVPFLDAFIALKIRDLFKKLCEGIYPVSEFLNVAETAYTRTRIVVHRSMRDARGTDNRAAIAEQ